MAKYTCARCGALLNTTTAEAHLCADLAKRYARQAKALDAIQVVFEKHGIVASDEVGLDIIRALSGRDLGVD